MRSKGAFPKGVNSPVRFFEPYPFFTRKARGSKIITEDRDELVDYCMAYGPLIFGHAPRFVSIAVVRQLRRGTVYGTPSCYEVRLAEDVKRAYGSISLIRFVNSGAEAAGSAVRLARAYTGRDAVVKIDGGYHGAVDPLMVNGRGSDMKAFSQDPEDTCKQTRAVAFQRRTSRISMRMRHALSEPAMGNVGSRPEKEYLRGLGGVRRAGAVLIFDEVTGRVQGRWARAQSLYGGSRHHDASKILGGFRLVPRRQG